MTARTPLDFKALYTRLQSPVAMVDCGDCCAPHNELGVPFCCDARHAIPTAYLSEWEYLKKNSNLWQRWDGNSQEETAYLRAQAPDDQVLIECKGHLHCDRQFRAFTCRAFPFFPYITRQGQFIGLTYFWEFEDRCWVVSHLEVVSSQFVTELVRAFKEIFRNYPQEKEEYRYQSSKMRRSFSQKHRYIPVLHVDGHTYEVMPGNGLLRKVPIETLPQFGVYKIAEEIPFPDEIDTPVGETDS